MVPKFHKKWTYRTSKLPKTLPHTIQSDPDTHIAYTDTGEGIPLLFIHGLGSNRHAFLHNTNVLSKHHRCLCIDLPGYGDSSKNKARVSMSYFAKQVSNFIKKLQLTNAVVVGHSMGAQVALKMIHSQPDLAKSLILIAPAGFETFNGFERQWFESITQPMLLKNATHDQILQSFYVNFHTFPKAAEFMLKDRLKLMESKQELDFYADLIYYATMAMLDEPIFQLLREIKKKSLIIFGQEDQLIPNKVLHPNETTLSVAQRGADQLAGSDLLMVPQAGHFVMFERPRLVNEAISKWIK